MKRKIVSIFFVITTLGFIACKQDTPTLFSEADGIYFSAPSDSILYTFAKHPNRTVDTIKIPVTVLGNPSKIDREITIEKLTGTDINATEGVHYKLLPPYKMPANQVTTQLPVVVYRTGDLDSITATIKLAVKANNSFALGMTSKTSIKIKTGYLQKPPTWGDLTGLPWAGYSTNLGTWTKTKYKVVLDALYDPVGDTTITEFPYSRLQPPAVYTQYLQLVKNYLRTKYPGNFSIPRGIGATLRDPDARDSVVLVGPANY